MLADAYAAFYKSIWNYAWQSAGYLALAEIDCRRGDWATALEHLQRSLSVCTDQLRARDLRAIVLRKLERDEQAEQLLKETLALDPLHWHARLLLGETISCDTQTKLDIAHDLARAGQYADAIRLLEKANADRGTAPTLSYTLAWLHTLAGDKKAAAAYRKSARTASPDYCFPHRVEEAIFLSAAVEAEPKDARARYYLGCLFYDQKRHRDAIKHWEESAQLDPSYAVVWRNLGIGYFNVLEKPAASCKAYDKAISLAPHDARLLFEHDLLAKRTATPPKHRLLLLEKKLDLVRRRDDLSVEYCDLLNSVGRHEDAQAYLASRRFQPWEGGEGLARGQHVRTHLALGRKALAKGDFEEARALFETALQSPENLGEARHLLANPSEVHYWLGLACEGLGDRESARKYWESAANFTGDFQERAVKSYSEMTYFSARSLEKLGRKKEARTLFTKVRRYAKQLFNEEAKVFYFATSLPARLLFEHLQRRQETTALLIEAQAEFGLGNRARGTKLLAQVLKRDPNRSVGRDLLQMQNGV